MNRSEERRIPQHFPDMFLSGFKVLSPVQSSSAKKVFILQKKIIRIMMNTKPTDVYREIRDQGLCRLLDQIHY
jgi:hypothetical protein